MSNYSNVEFSSRQTESTWYKLFQFIPEGTRVLDFGCSSGNLGAELKGSKKCTVVGVDLDAKDVKIASKKLDAAYVKNVETDDFKTLGKFDRIIFADVLEHLIDPVATLKKVKKLLTPGGKVLFSIPNMAHMGTRLMLLDGKFGYGETGLLDKIHLHFYDETEVRRIFTDAGLKIDNLDWTEYYIPRKEVEAKLTEVGLKATKQFYDNSKQVSAVALQYVGSATEDPEASSPELPAMSPWVNKTDEYIDMILSRSENELNSIKSELESLKVEHARLIGSRSWKLTKPLRLKNRLKRFHK